MHHMTTCHNVICAIHYCYKISTYLDSSQQAAWPPLLLQQAKGQPRPAAEEEALLPCWPGQLPAATSPSKQQLLHFTHLQQYRLVFAHMHRAC